MADFTQACLVYFLRYDSSNRVLFMALFTMRYVVVTATLLITFCSNGPLMWAIVLWKNSIVFHSIDKVTSSYIHILPSLVTYCFRWSPTQSQKQALFESDVMLMDFLWPYPIIMYLCWQVVYLFKTEWMDRDKLNGDDELGTSFRYLAKSFKNTTLHNLASSFGPRLVFLNLLYDVSV